VWYRPENQTTNGQENVDTGMSLLVMSHKNRKIYEAIKRLVGAQKFELFGAGRGYYIF